MPYFSPIVTEEFDEDEDADDERGGPTVVPPKPGDNTSPIPVVMIPDSDGKLSKQQLLTTGCPKRVHTTVHRFINQPDVSKIFNTAVVLL